MAAASLAVVGLLLVVTYEFQHANEFTESLKWMRFAHDGILAAISFSICFIMGIIQKVPYLTEKWKKLVGWAMTIALVIGLVILLFLLVILFINTA